MSVNVNTCVRTRRLDILFICIVGLIKTKTKRNLKISPTKPNRFLLILFLLFYCIHLRLLPNIMMIFEFITIILCLNISPLIIYILHYFMKNISQRCVLTAQQKKNKIISVWVSTQRIVCLRTTYPPSGLTIFTQ